MAGGTHRRFAVIALMAGAAACVPLSGWARRINGVQYISLSDLAGDFGMRREWVHPFSQAVLRAKNIRMEMEEHKRHFTLNQCKVHMGFPVARKGADLFVSERDYRDALKPLLTPQVFLPVPKLYRIVLDPGHGGKDPGARNLRLGLREKDLTLDLGMRLRKILRSRGYEVLMTREDDRFLDLEERAAFANRAKADLFISLHFNASRVRRVNGVECFVFTPRNQPSSARSKIYAADRRGYPANRNDTWNLLAGYYIQRRLVRELKTEDRGVKRARFAVLKALNCPGLLAEPGFLSNPGEAARLRNSGYREHVAQAIADGVHIYQLTLNRLRAR